METFAEGVLEMAVDFIVLGTSNEGKRIINHNEFRQIFQYIRFKSDKKKEIDKINSMISHTYALCHESCTSKNPNINGIILIYDLFPAHPRNDTR